jgi:Leucine-rich repeat (LRR) protein
MVHVVYLKKFFWTYVNGPLLAILKLIKIYRVRPGNRYWSFFPNINGKTKHQKTYFCQLFYLETTLRTLILRNNNLRSIPSEISDLHNLEYLDLSKNPLKVKDAEDVSSLPIELRLLVNLKYLNLRECSLRHIPLSVWLCITLETLDM